jgi:dihydroorotate dehydrogenase (fumarate)
MTADLTTRYLGMELPHPFITGASPLADELDMARSVEDAGAAAIVLRSLFEEQLQAEELATHEALDWHAESFAEAATFMPDRYDFALGPDEYLEQLQAVREAVDIPVIGSLNGVTPGGWLEFARLIEQAGAAAIELNLYQLATDSTEAAEDLERQTREVVTAVASSVKIPVAVKLSPFYTALASFARDLAVAGAAGLVIFNRFYQPDIDIEELEVEPALHLSDSSELLLRLRWLAILRGQINASLACTGGVHTVVDAVKAIMCGADVTQLVSVVLRHGPKKITELRDGLQVWLDEHEYVSVEEMKGSMSLERCPDPKAFERGNYMRILQSWRF